MAAGEVKNIRSVDRAGLARRRALVGQGKITMYRWGEDGRAGLFVGLDAGPSRTRGGLEESKK